MHVKEMSEKDFYEGKQFLKPIVNANGALNAQIEI